MVEQLISGLSSPQPAALFLWGPNPVMFGIRGGKSSDPAAIDDIALVGAGAAVIGRQEEHDPGDVVRHERALEALAAHQVGLAFGRQPPVLLPLGHDPSGHDGIDPHIVRPKIAGKRTGKALHRGLGGV